MRTTLITSLLCAGFAMAQPCNTFAQILNPKVEVGASGSGFLYHGDLTRSEFGDPRDFRYGFGIFGRYYFNPVFSGRLNIYRGGLKGDDCQYSEVWRQKRAYEFKSSLTEVSFMVEADLLGKSKFESYGSFGRHTDRWSVYLLAGVGAAFLNTTRDWSKLDRDWFGRDATDRIPLDSANSPDRRVLVLPMGMGIRYDLSKRTTLFAEAAYRLTFTDNLDGFTHSVYSAKSDGYTTYSFGISYRFKNRDSDGYYIYRRGWKHDYYDRKNQH